MPQWTQACRYLSELVFLFSSDKAQERHCWTARRVFWVWFSEGSPYCVPSGVCPANVFLYRPRSLTQLTPGGRLRASHGEVSPHGTASLTAGTSLEPALTFLGPHTRSPPLPPSPQRHRRNSYTFTVSVSATPGGFTPGVAGLHFAYCWSLSA